MDRRDFIKSGALAAGWAASPELSAAAPWPAAGSKEFKPVPKRRLGKTGWDLSIIGMGGIVIMNADQAVANNTVAQAFDAGINYFDVAPSYGDAQERLGPALKPYRDHSMRHASKSSLNTPSRPAHKNPSRTFALNTTPTLTRSRGHF